MKQMPVSCTYVPPRGAEECGQPAAVASEPAGVTIVMCTYQGERFLSDQFRSIAAQTHANWRLYISDDGSADKTREIAEAFRAEQERNNRVVVVANGPRRGFAINFLTALCASPKSAYYAFSDQDDIWEAGKLSRALSFLEATSGRPALYCGRTRIVDEAGRPTGLSPAFMRPPSFANALVQNIGGGNTMVMNDAARELLCAAGPDPDIAFHDWWAYQLVSGAGGQVYYDIEPWLLYRQHDTNVLGKNSSIANRIARLRFLFEGRLRGWTDRNIRALNRVRHLLTPQNRALLDAFAEARTKSTSRRLAALRRSGVHRQTRLGNLGLIVAAIFNKL